MMKKLFKNLTALLLIAVIVLSSVVASSAATSSDVLIYSDDSNSGERDVTCTTLTGTGASSYYTGSYSYESLSTLSSSALLSTLRTLMKSTHKKNSSYSDCQSMADETDCEKNNGRVTLFYTDISTTSSNWNREHVWPKSLGGYETSGPGADLHHIRPTDNQVNSTRSSLKFGEGGTKQATGGNAASGVLGGYYGNGYFEPLDNVKGDVARICLYMYVRYGGDYSKCSSITNVFVSVDVLLDWCAQDPVDTWEMGRNEVVEDYQGNRNVFIDYPELAWQLFDRSAPAGMSSPSSGNVSGGDPSCSHSSTELRGQTSGNCGISGYTGDTYCTLCGGLLKHGSTVSATGNHSWGAVVTVTPATETTNGSGKQTCTVCSTSKTVILPATGGSGGSGGGGSTDPGGALVSVSKTASDMSGSLSSAISLDDNITVEMKKGSAGTAPAYYSPAIRIYQGGGIIEVKAKGDATLTTVIISYDQNYNGNGNLTIVGGTLVSDQDGTITISATAGSKTITVTTGGTKSGPDRIYLTDITVQYADASVVTPPSGGGAEPDTPDTPDTPDVPGGSDTPDTPDNPDVPDTPTTPDEPITPDVPSAPKYGSVTAIILAMKDENAKLILLVSMGMLDSVYYALLVG